MSFKEVNELHNACMLAHLKDFKFTLMLSNLKLIHLLFVDCLDSYLLFGFLMSCKIYYAKLTFSKLAIHIVKFFEVTNICNLPQNLNPILLGGKGLKVKDADFSLSKANLDRIKGLASVCSHKRLCLRDECISKTVHNINLIHIT